MNREQLDFLTAAENTEIQNDTDDLLADTQVSVAITYRDFQSVTKTLTTGTYTSTYTDSNIRAIRDVMGAREIRAGEGLYEVGDNIFIVAQSDLSVTPRREDRIVLGSETYEVIRWFQDPLGKCWRIIARLVIP